MDCSQQLKQLIHYTAKIKKEKKKGAWQESLEREVGTGGVAEAASAVEIKETAET